MIKKLLTILLILTTITGCTASAEHIVNPISSNDDSYYKAFNDEAKETLSSFYDDLDDMPASMIQVGTELPDIELTTYDGKTINLSDYKGKKVVVELVAYWCAFCKDETSTYIDEIVSSHDDTVFIQSFVEGAKEDTITDEDGNSSTVDTIKQFYDEAEASMNDNVIITQESSDLETYVYDTLDLDYYPCFLFFDEDGKLCFLSTKLLEADKYDQISDTFLQENSIRLYNNLADGLDIASDYVRTWKDVKEDYSQEQQEQLKALSIDENYGEEIFYSNVGKKIDVDTTLVDINGEVLDLTDKTGTTVYTFLSESGENLSEEIKVLNKFVKASGNDVTFITFLITDDSANAEEMYEKLDVKPDTYILDAKEDTTEALYDILIFSSPETVFVSETDKVCTGTYVGTYSLEALQKAYTFMSSSDSYKVK